jgi:hypothetical protein
MFTYAVLFVHAYMCGSFFVSYFSTDASAQINITHDASKANSTTMGIKTESHNDTNALNNTSELKGKIYIA